MTDYSEDKIARIIHLWNDQLYIADDIGEEFGVSRSAILGLIRRLRASGELVETEARIEANKSRPNMSVERRMMPKEKAVVKPAVSVAKPYVAQPERKTGTVTMAQLGRHDCKWPIGDPSSETFSFCGRQAEGARAYCTEHLRVARPPGNPTPAVSEGPRKAGSNYKYTPRFYSNQRK